MIRRLYHPASLGGFLAVLVGLAVGETGIVLLGCVLVFVQSHLDG